MNIDDLLARYPRTAAWWFTIGYVALWSWALAGAR